MTTPMFLVRATIVLVIALGSHATPAQAQPAGNDEQAMVSRVNESIANGISFLRKARSKERDRNWEGIWLNMFSGQNGGVTALATLALLNCGVPPDDKDVAPALEYLRSLAPKRTYVSAVTILVLAEARQPKDLQAIQKHVDGLLKSAIRKGDGGKLTGWSYGDENRTTDASNTQYALLGLYAGKLAGAKIPESVWQEIRQLYVDTMVGAGKEEAYWVYGGSLNRPSFTMTAAGVSGLVIAMMASDESFQQLDPATGVATKCGLYPAKDRDGKDISLADVARRGLNWTGKRFAFDKAPGSMSTYYNVYGIERVGRLSGQRFIGDHDWYREGCEWLLKEQNPVDSGWLKTLDSGAPLDIDRVSVISTSFALLFLSKGKTPILISKLAYGDHRIEQDRNLIEIGQPVGWNRKFNDARNMTEFASRELFRNLPLGWQVYDPRRRELVGKVLLEEVGILVQSPILYITGHKSPMSVSQLSDQQKLLIRKYIEEGGFVIAEACCGSPEFAQGFRELMKEQFPGTQMQPVDRNHALWRSHFFVPPDTFPKLECLERGCRTVVVLSPEPLAGFWEERRFMPDAGAKVAANRGQEAFRLSANIIAYATGKEPPRQRLSMRRIAGDPSIDGKAPPRGFVKPAQIQIEEQPPAPAAMRNLMAHLRDTARLDVVLDKEYLSPVKDDLFPYYFLYMHGRKTFTFGDAELDNIKSCLNSRHVLFADACCGSPEFDKAFRDLVEKMYPGRKLEPIPTSDELYSERLNGKGQAITTVKRREKTTLATEGVAVGNDAGYESLPPSLEGLKIDGRWAIIYSKYDIGCALEGHKSSDCLGHTTESAKRLAAAAVLYSLKRLPKE